MYGTPVTNAALPCTEMTILFCCAGFSDGRHLLRNGVKVCIGAAKLYRIFVKL